MSGTVFRVPGLSVRGAEVVVSVTVPKKKEWKAVTDSRGEYVIRVPAGPASYNVIARAAGFQSQEKSFTLVAAEQVDLNFMLEPAQGKR